MMGGEIRVKSEVGKGSIFSFRAQFACIETQGEDADRAESSGLDVFTFDGRLRGTRVLLVEDNAINRQVASEILDSLGISVKLAESGLEALDRLLGVDEPPHYDAVLMDIQMPGMDGFETTRRIRRDARYADIPIVAMTAYAMIGDREKCLDAGMNDYVSKPIDVGTLFVTLDKWISSRMETAPQSTVEAPPESADSTTFPDNLPGLDLANGLQRVVGNSKLYGRLVNDFLSDYSAVDVQLTHLLEQGDMDGAERLAHTLKGVTGNLGAHRLNSLAEQLNRALRAEQITSVHDANNLLHELSSALREALGSMEQTLRLISDSDGTEHEDVFSEETLEPDVLRPLLEKMHGLLLEQTFGACDMADELSRRLQRTRFAEDADALKECMRTFDFQSGLDVLADMTAKLKTL